MASPGFPRPQELAADTFFVEGPASNWMILREGSEFTVIDGGYPADTPAVVSSIASLGLVPEKAAAMLVTHSHIDHTGAASFFAAAGVPVLSAAAEVNAMKGLEKFQVNPKAIIRRVWRPRVFKWTRHVFHAGGLKSNNVASAAAWEARTLSTLPGAPEAVLTPGHSPGHTAYHLPRVKALVTGDALVTGHGMSACTGPQMLNPIFHHNLPKAYESLGILAAVDAEVILPGHGAAINRSTASAVAAIPPPR